VVSKIASGDDFVVYRRTVTSDPESLTEVVRRRLYRLSKQKRFRRDALAQRLGVVESAVTKNLRIEGRPLTIEFVAHVADLAQVPIAELVVPKGSDIKQVDAEEAMLLRYMRKWPRPTLRALLAFLTFFANEPPAETLKRNFDEQWRRLRVQDRERLYSYAIVFREQALGPDQLQALDDRVIGGAQRDIGGRVVESVRVVRDDDETDGT
jgi:transcriptional regulator with XRE-family HTH domain